MCCSSYPYFSNLMCCSSYPYFSNLRGMRWRPSWPVEPRTTQGAPALKGSLPGGRSLLSCRWTRRPRFDRPCNTVWPPYVEALQGAPLCACWLRKGINKLATPLGNEDLAIMADLSDLSVKLCEEYIREHRLADCWRIKDVSTYDPQAYGPAPFSPQDSHGSCQSAEQGYYKRLIYLYSLTTLILTMIKLENN
jgi:hypothetical protein